MSSLTGQSSSTKSLTGLSDTYSNSIFCDTLEVADEFTCDPGCVITLPPASIQDSYLTANVAFRNQINNFTLANNFASTTTHNGTTTNNGTSNFNAVMNVNNGTIQNFFSTGGTLNSRIQQTASGLQLVNGNNLGTIGLYTRTSGGVVGANVIGQNGNTAYLQGNANNRVFVTGSTTPTITIQAPLNSNDFSIVNSAWVVSQAFAKLAGPQTFTGDQNFPTQATSNNSTLAATTAYVKNNLLNYALLSPPSGQTFTGLNNFPTQATSDNSTLVATTAYVKNNLLNYALLAGTQTFTGTNTFNALTIGNAIYRNFQSIQAVFPADFRILDSTQTKPTQMYQFGNTCIIDGNFASSKIQITTKDASSIGVNNLVMESGNTCYLQGAAGLGIGMVGSAISLDGVCSFTNTTTPVITQSISLADNSTKIATTAFVKNQNYITASSLTPYALLAPPSGQTFTGLNNFPTQATSDNSTLVATTAYVKNNLLDYGKLTLATGATLQSWFGSNRFSSNGSNLPISLRNTDASTYGGGMFICSAGGQFNGTNQVGDVSLLSTGTTALNTGALSLTTWSSTNCGIRITSNAIAYNGANHNFNGNISLGLYNLDILNAGRTRGMRISNNGSNNGTTDIEGVGVSTRFNFYSSDGTGTRLNNFFISDSNTCYLQGAAGLGIGMIGSAISLDGVCAFTNTTTPVITQSISLADNSTKIATTSFVKGQNYITSSALTPYALLNPTTTQTFAGTGDNVFSNIVTCTSGLNSNSNITLFSGALSSNIRQNTLGLEITNVDLSKYIQLITRTPAGGNTIGVSCANGNSAYIQGDPGAQISITNQQANIGGSAPPTISTNPFNSDSSNKIASTSFVKNQGYAILNPPALQIWGTNQNQFNTQVNMNATPIRFVDGLRSSQISQSGNALIIKNNSNVNSVQLRSTTAGLVERTGITVQNGNETIIQGGSAGIIRVLGNDATIECDNFKSNAPFECGYLQLGTPITAKTNYDIGYQWSIQGSSFNSWSGFTAFGNVYTLAWDGTGDKTLGVWLCDICIATNTTSAMDSGFVLNITNNFVINTRSAWSNALTSFGVNQAQIVRLSTVLNITTLTDTYYLNFKINGGSSRTDVPGASQMSFTRIA